MVERNLIYKVIVVGDPMVGKTSLLRQFATKSFKDDYIRTIGTNIIKKTVIIDGTTVDLLVWDISGHKEVSEMFASYFDGANAVIMVYDITRPKTLENIPRWYQECLDHGIGHTPTVLVGNKTDLERMVEKRSGKEMGKGMKTPYFETSAKTGNGVKDVFYTIARKLCKRDRRKVN